MPPHKSVRSLEELSISSIGSFVHETCKKIEENFPSTSASSYDSSQCKAAVQILQDHLREYIAPALWEEIFYKILGQHHESKAVDERILISTFLFENVKIRKLNIPQLSEGKWLHVDYKRRAEYWVQRVRTMPNLVEVWFNPDDIECDRIVQEVCATCTKLEAIYLPRRTSDETKVLVIKSCKNLRKVKCDLDFSDDSTELVKRALQQLENLEQIDCPCWAISNEILASLDRKLKLTKLSIDLCDPKDINTIAERCPHLVDVTIDIYENLDINTSQIFENLSSSVLKISKLSLFQMNVNYKDLGSFICAKGIHITELSIIYGDMSGSPQSLLEVLSKCNNLKKLSLYTLSWSPEKPSILTRAKPMTFPKLWSVQIQDYNNAGKEGLVMAEICLSNSKNLTSLELMLHDYTDDQTSFDESLFRLFNNQQVKKLKYLLLYRESEISELLARHIVKSCPELTRLGIEPLSAEATDYFEQLHQEVTCKNLDFTRTDLDDDKLIYETWYPLHF